jgi:hypothetical protein
MTRTIGVVLVLFFLKSVRAFAHVLMRAETQPASWTGAISVRDAGVSQIFYGRAGPDEPECGSGSTAKQETREALGLADILSLFSVRRFVRDFHELGRSQRED